MSKRIDFYVISLNHANAVTNYSVCDFLESIDQRMHDENGGIRVTRRIGEKLIRIFQYYFSTTRRQFVIPFGKLKEKNLPYWLNNENHLEEIPEELYDINSLGFDKDTNVMVFTTNREGPSVQNVADYLNTFIPRNLDLRIEIAPLRYNTGIEKIRNAELVRNVILSLDLGRTLNNFYHDEAQMNQERTLLSSFKALAAAAKEEGDSRTLELTLGLGTAKNSETLNRDSILELLEHINITEDFVKEITVRYKNGKEEKVDRATLKQSSRILNFNCTSRENQISPECLLTNINQAVADKIIIITRGVAEYRGNLTEYDAGEIEIVEDWRPEVAG